MQNLLESLEKLDPDKIWDVSVKEKKAGKTMAQLRGFFGVWCLYLSDVEAQSVDEIHKMLKAKFLARIYFTNPTGLSQVNWVEKIGYMQELGRTQEVKIEAEKISLSWASLPQMKAYMSAVEEHYVSVGRPLPVLDKKRRRKSFV